MDEPDRRIVNSMQTGFPICERPFLEVAGSLGISEDELITRIDALLAAGVLTRFGPLFQIERMGGAFSLCALKIPEPDYERVAAIVNSRSEVAHNYARDHEYNMWFVLATERPEQIEQVIEQIACATGYEVLNLPKQREYFVGLNLHV